LTGAYLTREYGTRARTDHAAIDGSGGGGGGGGGSGADRCRSGVGESNSIII